MDITLLRTHFLPTRTLGSISVNGKFLCYSCEDRVRPPGEPKVYGETAIPFGTYEVVVTMSNRFKVRMPLLLNVPGFEGIRIHPGNTEANTEGCILPGLDRLPTGVGRSRLAYNQLFNEIEFYLGKGERVNITIADSRKKV